MQHNAMWTLFIISIISSFHGVTPLFRARIPIGAIFDDDSLASHSAFRYEIEKHNNNSKAVYKIDRYEKIVNVDDNYQLINAICSTLNRGVFTFFSMAGVKALSSVDSLASKYNIPILHPSSPHIQAFKCKDNSGVAPESTRSRSNPCAVDRVANDQSLYNIRMLPAYHRAIIDLIVHYQWRTVYYLYDTDSGLYRLPHIFDAIRRRKLRVELEVVRVADSGNSYALLRELDKKATREQEKYFVLDISDRDSMRSILTQIQNVGMNRLSYHYLLGGMIMDELDLKDFIHGGVNISGFRMVNPQSRKVIQKINEWKNLHPNRWNGIGKVDKIKLDVALTIDAVQVVSHALKRLVLTKGGKLARAFRHGQMYNNGTLGIRCNIRPKYSGSSSASTRLQVPFEFGNMINNEIKKVSFHGLTGKLNFDAFGQRTDYSIDVLELSQFRNPRKIGVWSSRAGLNIERQTMVPRLSSSSNDSRPSVRIITSIISAPYLMHRKEPEEGGPLIGNDRFEGFCAELAKKVADIVGFEYLIQLVADDKYGSMLDDGNWNGMVGELSRNKADLAVAPLTITSMRERLIDFSKPFMSLGISIMIKKPEKQKPGVFSFMDPLSYEIWMYVILAYVVVSVTLFLVSRFSPYEWHVEDSQQGAAFTNDFTMLNSLWFSLGAIMQQGCDISPRLASLP